MVDKHQTFVEIRDVLNKIQADKDKSRAVLNAEIGHDSPGTYVKVGNLVMFREADSSLSRQGPRPLDSDLESSQHFQTRFRTGGQA